jgi:hypothetical protein
MAFPSTFNFSYYRGDSYQFVIRPKTSNSQQFDLTGYASEDALFTIALSRGSAGISSQKLGTVDIDDSEGTITCTISPTVGKTLTAGTWVYDVQIEDTTGEIIYTILTGTVTVTDEISGATA